MSIPKEDRKKQELRKKIEYQVKCDERAHRIVERLIDNPIPEELLLDSVRYITVHHYGDITEERAISKLCGYPLCTRPLGNVPKQKYSISTKTNKVYNIENRKNFCSGSCYQASQHLEKQISTSPLWTRKDGAIKLPELLPLDHNPGLIGDQVLVSAREEITGEVKKLEHIDKYHSALHDRQQQAAADKSIDVNPSPCNKADPEHETRTKSVQPSKVNASTSNADQLADQLSKEIKTDDMCVYDLETALDAVGLKPGGNTEGNVEVSEADGEKNLNSASGDVLGKVQQVNVELEKTLSDSVKATVSKTPSEKLLDADISNDNSSYVKKKQSGTTTIKSKTKGSRKETDSLGAKTDQLMKLLNKRQSLLSKMADIQPTVNIQSKAVSQGDQDQLIDNTIHTGLGNEEVSTHKLDNTSEYCLTERNVVTSDVIEKHPSVLLTVNKSAVSEAGIKGINTDISCRLTDKEIDSKQSIETTDSNPNHDNSSGNVESKEKMTGKPQKRLSTLELICRSMQSWVTADTVEYLDTDVAGATVDDGLCQTEFSKQYKSLVAKVDAQEMDFSDLLGEESLDEGPSQPTAPAPHFEVLKVEIEEDRFKVNEFIKGSFTYKVQERATMKEDDGSSHLVLPTVDRYDQLLIRQRIVLDRISKVLPNLLSPLHLLAQDVYTELKDVVLTFNLTSENILFKPSEWTLVMLILLRLISRKVPKLQESFATTSAEKFFKILLGGISSDMSSLDLMVGRLLQKRTKKTKRDS